MLGNSADPDEMPPYAAFHLGLHCFAKYLFTWYPEWKGLKHQSHLQQKTSFVIPFLIFFSEIELDISYKISAGRRDTGNIKAYLGNQMQ